eukprot:TRINITY_DN4912_c0_g1_i1.p1 TRINITY_DN4912_c0_g1~~TRINITY_DN4912_c0_g1_i1.p1  ORF type:complete len:169 (+),score=55.87 TRINITY_DN4912_c0_g1_i1:19-525(+)
MPRAKKAKKEEDEDVKVEENVEKISKGKGRIQSPFTLGLMKRIMQTDEDVGKIAKTTSFLMATIAARFLQHLTEKTVEAASAQRAKQITVDHLKDATDAEELFDFLAELTEDAKEAEKTPKKRGRKKKADDASNPTSEDGEPVKKQRGRPKPQLPQENGKDEVEEQKT